MPKLTEPVVIQQANYHKWFRLEIEEDDEGRRTARILFKRGWKDNDGTETWFDPPVHHLVDNERVDEEFAKLTTGLPLGTELILRCYAILEDDGAIPAGGVMQ